MRAAALCLLLIALAPGALGVTMPSSCGMGSTGNTTCYQGAVFKSSTTGAYVGNTTFATLPYVANTVCVVWQFHCTSTMAMVVASAQNALVSAALPCTNATLGMTAVVATGMDATYCSGGLSLVTQLAMFLDSWTACNSSANCNVIAAPAGRPETTAPHLRATEWQPRHAALPRRRGANPPPRGGPVL